MFVLFSIEEGYFFIIESKFFVVVFLSSSIPSSVKVSDGWEILELIALNLESILSNLFLLASVK